MILGNGLVANGFKSYENEENYLIFASGVSNSANTDADLFKRERDLLVASQKKHPEKTLVYFSTCSIYDDSLKGSPYVHHKLAMEELVQSQKNFHIFRISNLAGKTPNPHTVLNFFIQHILSGNFFRAWENASRNIIDMDDAFAIGDQIIRSQKLMNRVVNIANTANYPVPQIIDAIEQFTGRKGNYEYIERGSNPVIDTQLIEPVARELGIRFEGPYLQNMLQKYYSIV